LLLGRRAKTADTLYAVANHASPTGGWVEEQAVKGAPPKLAGDQPHCWAATMFVRLAISMLAYERGGTLHLLGAVPHEWLEGGKVNKLDRVQTTGGPISLSIVTSADGRRVKVEVHAPQLDNIALETRCLTSIGFALAGNAKTPETLPVRRGAVETFEFVK
jgi:hypothetical protein